MTATAETPTATTTATDLNRVLPAFVYGTLRKDQGNWSWALKGRTTSDEVATLTGAQMFSGSGFPFVSMTDAAESDVVVGDLFYIDSALFPAVVRDLDGLEGFRGEGVAFNMYDRKVVTVTTASGEQVEAYTYLVSADLYERQVRNNPVVGSGDWLTYIAERGPRY